MARKRIIPCLDIKNGRVVKGVNFVNFKDAGDPAEIAEAYSKAGADEIVFLDIDATADNRPIMLDVISRAAGVVTVPLTIGGGISTLDDIEKLLSVGASKVSINSAAIKNPNFIKEASQKYSSSRIIIALDVKKNESGVYELYLNRGSENTGIDALEFAKRAENLGAGELLITSVDTDGVQNGYDLEITGAIAKSVSIPVIASGGAGKLSDFRDAIESGADAVLAASIFHFGKISIKELREYLDKK